jgi:hypothetical protein
MRGMERLRELVQKEGWWLEKKSDAVPITLYKTNIVKYFFLLPTSLFDALQPLHT